MILSDVFQRFVEDSPVCVMAQALMENALPPSDRRRPLRAARPSAVHARPALLGRRPPDEPGRLPASDPRSTPPSRRWPPVLTSPGKRSTTRSIGSRRPPVPPWSGTAAPPSRRSSAPWAAANEPWLQGYRTRILDGSHLPGTEHRIKPAADDPRRGLARPVPGRLRPRDDAGRRRDPLRGRPRSGTLDDRGHPGAGPAQRPVDRRPQLLHHGVALRDRRARRLVRDPPARLDVDLGGRRRARLQGRCETGAVFEQKFRLTNDEGEILFVRRVTVELDEPTRDGDRSIHILTNLPEEDADAIAVARSVPKEMDAGDRVPRIGGGAQRRDQHAWAIPRRRCSPSAWPWWPTM